MYFYVPFHFFKLFFNFPFVAKAGFCKSRAHGGTPKGGKISVPFLLNQMAFLHVFLHAIFFFKVFFNFTSVSKPAFCKSRAHRGTLKGGKMSLLFLSDKTAFLHLFLRAISFFKLFFSFPFVAKAAFCKSRAHGGTPKGVKISVPFFLNQMAFLHVFLRAISLFQSLFQFSFRCKSSILQV